METDMEALIKKVDLLEEKMNSYVKYADYIAEQFSKYIEFCKYITKHLENNSTLTYDEYSALQDYYFGTSKGLEYIEKLEKFDIVIQEAERNKKLNKLGF